MQRYEHESNLIPPPQHQPLEHNILKLTPRQHTPRITHLAHTSLDEQAKIPTEPKLILYTQPAVVPKVPRPLSIDFPLEVECFSAVGDVPWDDEEGETDPEHECVDGEEGSVVEEETSR
jgi:hypothetical protein